MDLKDFFNRNCLGDLAFNRNYLSIPFHIIQDGYSYVVATTGYLMIAVQMAGDDYTFLSDHPFGSWIPIRKPNGQQFELSVLKNWLGNPSWPDFSCGNCKKLIPCPECQQKQNWERNLMGECANCWGESEIVCPHCDLTICINDTRVGKINGELYDLIHIARSLDYFQDALITLSTGFIQVPYVRITGTNWFTIVCALDKNYHPENPNEPFPVLDLTSYSLR